MYGAISMLPRKLEPAQTAGLIGLQNWLRRQFVDNRRYDRVVADLLVATGGDEAGRRCSILPWA